MPEWAGSAKEGNSPDVSPPDGGKWRGAENSASADRLSRSPFDFGRRGDEYKTAPKTPGDLNTMKTEPGLEFGYVDPLDLASAGGSARDISNPDGRSESSAVDAVKFGAFLALDPTGGVLVLCNMLLRYVLEDRASNELLGDTGRGAIEETRRTIGRQELTSHTRFDVGSYADLLFTPGEGMIKLLFDISSAAVGPTAKAVKPHPSATGASSDMIGGAIEIARSGKSSGPSPANTARPPASVAGIDVPDVPKGRRKVDRNERDEYSR